MDHYKTQKRTAGKVSGASAVQRTERKSSEAKRARHEGPVSSIRRAVYARSSSSSNERTRGGAGQQNNSEEMTAENLPDWRENFNLHMQGSLPKSKQHKLQDTHTQIHCNPTAERQRQKEF